MPSNSSAFRITLLLYIGVLLIPLGFFYTYSNVQESAPDISTVRKLGQVGTEMLIFTAPTPTKDIKKSIQKINNNLKEIETWVNTNKQSEFYVGGRTIQADFNIVKQCWQKLNKSPQKENIFHCLKALNSLSFTIEKMHTLKENKIKNMFYVNIIGTLILLLLLIYFVRSYIEIQLKKHAIHDHETKLYNKKYLMAELKSTCARSERYDYPLTLLSVAIEGLKESNYDDTERIHLFEQLGGILISMVRSSDVACRYNENHLVVMLPFTEEKNAEILRGRIAKQLETHDFTLKSKPNFKLTLIGFKHGESPEVCIERADRFLKE